MEMARAIQEKHLEILAANSGFEFTRSFFPYTSGEICNYYVHSEVVQKNGYNFREAIHDLRILIDSNIYHQFYDVISGGESRDWIFSYPSAFLLGKSHASLYKDGRITGADLSNKKIIHVADLNNEGSSVKNKWVPLIKRAGGEIKKIFFYVDRCEEGFEIIKELGLESNALVYLDQNAWSYLLKIGVTDPEIDYSLRERMENRESWARKILKSDLGIERMAELLRENNREKERALKVLNKYADLREEILDRLKKYSGIEILINSVNV